MPPRLNHCSICSVSHAGKVAVVDLADGSADEFAHHRIGAAHLAFVFQLELAGDAGQGGVDVADARHDERFAVHERAPLGVGDDQLHGGDGQALADAAALVDFLVFARGEGHLLHDFAHVLRNLDRRRRRAAAQASCAVMAMPSSSVSG